MVQTRTLSAVLVSVFVFYLTAAVCCLARQGCVTGREGGGDGVVVVTVNGGGESTSASDDVVKRLWKIENASSTVARSCHA